MVETIEGTTACPEVSAKGAAIIQPRAQRSAALGLRME
jgi:hypothetical protein